MEANADVKVNREYKDRLFRFIFGSPENKHYLLSLYNAVNEASDKVVAEAIKYNYFDGFIKKHAEGVKDMSLTEYNEEEFIENRRAEGRAEGALEMLISLVKDGLLSLQEAAKRAGMTEADFKAKC